MLAAGSSSATFDSMLPSLLAAGNAPDTSKTAQHNIARCIASLTSRTGQQQANAVVKGLLLQLQVRPATSFPSFSHPDPVTAAQTASGVGSWYHVLAVFHHKEARWLCRRATARGQRRARTGGASGLQARRYGSNTGQPALLMQPSGTPIDCTMWLCMLSREGCGTRYGSVEMRAAARQDLQGVACDADITRRR